MEADAATVTGFVIGILQAYGLAGLVMGAMAFIIKALWTDNKFLRTTLFDVGTKSIEAQNATGNALALLRTDIMSGRHRDNT